MDKDTFDKIIKYHQKVEAILDTLESVVYSSYSNEPHVFNPSSYSVDGDYWVLLCNQFANLFSEGNLDIQEELLPFVSDESSKE